MAHSQCQGDLQIYRNHANPEEIEVDLAHCDATLMRPAEEPGVLVSYRSIKSILISWVH